MPYIVKSTKTLPLLAEQLNAVVRTKSIGAQGLPLAGLTLTFSAPAATCVFPAAAVATITSGNAETYAMTDGMTLLVRVNGGPVQTALFETADFVGIGVATAAEVAAVIATDIPDAAAADDGGSVRIDSSLVGRTASIEVVGGTANAVLGFAAGVVRGSGDASGYMTVPEILAALNTSLNGSAIFVTSVPFTNDGVSGHILRIEGRLSPMTMTVDATAALLGFSGVVSVTQVTATDIVHAGEAPDGFAAIYWEAN